MQEGVHGPSRFEPCPPYHGGALFTLVAGNFRKTVVTNADGTTS